MSDRTTSAEAIESDLETCGSIRPGGLVTRSITIAEVLYDNGGTPYTELVRMHPHGRLNGSDERGLLGDALDDSRARRRQNNN
jgi:hypothetical protein